MYSKLQYMTVDNFMYHKGKDILVLSLWGQGIIYSSKYLIFRNSIGSTIFFKDFFKFLFKLVIFILNYKKGNKNYFEMKLLRKIQQHVSVGWIHWYVTLKEWNECKNRVYQLFMDLLTMNLLLQKF